VVTPNDNDRVVADTRRLQSAAFSSRLFDRGDAVHLIARPLLVAVALATLPTLLAAQRRPREPQVPPPSITEGDDAPSTDATGIAVDQQGSVDTEASPNAAAQPTTDAISSVTPGVPPADADGLSPPNTTASSTDEIPPPLTIENRPPPATANAPTF